MICKNCGKELQDSTLLICPHCGKDPAGAPAAKQVEEVQVVAPAPAPRAKAPAAPAPPAASRPQPETQAPTVVRGMSGCAWGVVLATLIACVLLAFIAAGLGGAYQGLKQRNAASQALAYEHYSRGMVHLEAGEIDLAEAEFEQAIRVSPGTSMEAYDELKKIRANRRVEPTPTSAVVRQAGDDILAQAKTEYETGNWEQAIIKLEQVQSLDAGLERETIQDMLHDAYMKYGRQLLEEERPEEARRSFESALDIRPDDEEARREQTLVTDYMTASGYWGANWEEAISNFTQLYRRNRDYLDVSTKLFEAHQYYGDFLAEEEEWCEAAAQYAQALALRSDSDVREAYDETGSQCETGPPPIEEPPAQLAESRPTPAEATEAVEEATGEPTAAPEAQEEPSPTPEAASEEQPAETEAPAPSQPPAEEEPTEEATEEPASEAPPPSGVLAYSTYDLDEIRRIYQIEVGEGTDPEIIQQDASQPAFSQDGTRLAFRSWQGDITGIRVSDVGGRNGYNVTKFLEDGFPSFGPDGTQLALSSTRESDRRPRVYTTWADGVAESVQLGLGERPAWSSTGWIAYHGCDPGGGNCGIWKMAPNGKGQVGLTTNNSDTSPAWSPDGGRLAFMSARDENWEIYTVGADGGQPTRLTNDDGEDGLPAWSPDGNWIAFVSSRGGAWAIYLIPAAGGEPQKLWDVPNLGREWMEQRLTWR